MRSCEGWTSNFQNFNSDLRNNLHFTYCVTRFGQNLKQILSTVAPDAAASADKDKPGSSSPHRSDGGPGQSTDPATGWARGCSSGTAAGAGIFAAGGDEAEKGPPRVGTGERSHWNWKELSFKFWDVITNISTYDSKKKMQYQYRIYDYLLRGWKPWIAYCT